MATKAKKKKVGRPSIFSEKLAAAICDRIGAGETLRAICREEKMPSFSVAIKWLLDLPEFQERYARAKRLRIEVMAEDLQFLADESRVGKKTEEKHVAWVCTICRREIRFRGEHGWGHKEAPTEMCKGAKHEEVVELKTVTADMIERSKLQVDTRKWLLARLASKTYGDKVQVDQKVEVQPGTIAWSVMPDEMLLKRSSALEAALEAGRLEAEQIKAAMAAKQIEAAPGSVEQLGSEVEG